MLTRNFKKFLRKQNTSRVKDFNKMYKGEGKKNTKEVTCYECKKSGHIKSECPKLKFKNKGVKDKKKAFKATWDNCRHPILGQLGLGVTENSYDEKTTNRSWIFEIEISIKGLIACF